MFKTNTKRGIELSSAYVSWVEMKVAKKGPRLTQFSSNKLPDGAIKPHFGKENIGDRSNLQDIIMQTIPEGKKGGHIALTLPDQLAKISLLKFDEVPDKKEELEKLILWRLKKSVPLSTDDIKLDYMVLASKTDEIEILTSLASKTVIREYEDLLRALGLKPKVVDIYTMNSLSMYKHMLGPSSIFVALSDMTTSIAIIDEGVLKFFRSKETKGNIKKITQEIMATVSYCLSTFTKSPFSSLYIHSGRADTDLICKEMEKLFDGAVVRMGLSGSHVEFGDDLHPEDYLSPAIGGALRL